MADLNASTRRREFPFEAYVNHGNGAKSFSAYARVNADRTVTVLTFEPPAGFVENTFAEEMVRVKLSAESRNARWTLLYEQVYVRSNEKQS